MVEIVVVQPEDYEPLARFMAGFAGVRPRSVESWRSRLLTWWDRNPAYDPSFARGWMLRDDGRIVGFFGSLPLKMQLGGVETTAFGATSWRVEPAHRGRSLTLKLRQLQAHKSALHFSTTPREDLVPLLQKLGYQPIDRGAGAGHQSVVIRDFATFLRFRFRGRPGAAALVRLGAPLLRTFQALRLRRVRSLARGDVRELTRADEAFDALWARTRARFANTNVRTAAMVNWYCFGTTPTDKKLLACYQGGTLVGYMILFLREDPARRLMECVDVWIDPAAGEERVLGALVGKADACARAGGFHRLIFPHFDGRTAALYESLGLIRGPAWKKREYMKGPPELMRTITPENSYFVRAQGDYGL